jgi:hypothetical protein
VQGLRETSPASEKHAAFEENKWFAKEKEAILWFVDSLDCPVGDRTVLINIIFRGP